MRKHQRCPLCEQPQLRPLAEYYDAHGLVKCQNCRFVCMERIPTLEELNDHYSTYAYEGEGYLSPLTVQSYQRLLDEWEPFRKNNRILDVGCGRGWFLIEAKKRGWKVFGTEFSEAGVARCREAGIDIRAGALTADSFPPGHFDIITSFEVIEHINNPRQELRYITDFLRAGGLFYCTTPNFDSLMRYYLKADYDVIGYPEHLCYYTVRTLNHAAGLYGLRPIKVLTTGLSLTRLRTSQKQSEEAFVSQTSADEHLRQRIAQKWYLGVAKSLINRFLTLTQTGMTLKGYYQKPEK